MKRIVKWCAPTFLVLALTMIPAPKARAGFFIGLDGASFSFYINSGLGVYQASEYPGFLYCTDDFCYRWVGYGWDYAPWGGGPWAFAPEGFLLPPPLIYGPPPPLVFVYRPYFAWWRGYVGPWYAIHHPIWWRANHPYITHYNTWRVHVVRTYGPHVSAAVWTQPRVMGMRPRFLPAGHRNIRWAQRQWARNRPDLYGRRVIHSFYRAHPQFLRGPRMMGPHGRFGPRPNMRGQGPLRGSFPRVQHYRSPQGSHYAPNYARPFSPRAKPGISHGFPSRRPYARPPHPGRVPRRCRNPRHCF